MKKVILSVAFVVLLFFVLSLTKLGSQKVSADMPCGNCYKLTGNIDKSVQNADPEYRATYLWLNPCTGAQMLSDYYANYYDAPYVSRREFENGDVEGHRMNTRYVLCSDGRAKVENWALYYIQGMSWGVWFNHPLVDWASQYKMTECSTMSL